VDESRTLPTQGFELPEPSATPGYFYTHTVTRERTIRIAHEGPIFSAFRNDQLLLKINATDEALDVTPASNVDTDEVIQALLGALENLFAVNGAPEELRLIVRDQTVQSKIAVDCGAVGGASENIYTVRGEQFFQHPELWLNGPLRHAFPLRYVFTDGKRHPLRAPKPRGTVYARWIPWLTARFSLRTIAGEPDLRVFHDWMNDPRVNYYWEEAGTIERHHNYLAELSADPHMLPLLGCVDDRPFCYFEIYWARENRLGPYYDALDHDRGWHVVVGEENCRGRDWVTAWLPSLMHYMFLDDPRTQRIVGEPRIDHTRQLKNLDHAGFARIKHVTLPHKRAVLVRLERERFFSDRLWAPSRG
jgi:acetyl CoA:N6-hydroxylysine acetyl transferase